MKITVVITTWQVPFDQVVQAVREFENAERARLFINAQSQQWWVENDGDRCLKEYPETEAYEPIQELGYNHARYELWGGESGFHAMIDAESAAQLHEEHYQREFDAQGISRPGYLVNAYVAGQKPGGMTDAEEAKYTQQQAEGIAALEVAYGNPTKN